MDDFEERARRAGGALNHSVIDLEPGDATTRQPRSRRHLGIASVVIAALVVGGGVAASQRDDNDGAAIRGDPDSPTTTASTAASMPHYLPRWMPADLAPSTGTGVKSVCIGASAVPTTVTLPPSGHSATFSGTFQLQFPGTTDGASGSVEIRPATAAAVDGCDSPLWSATFVGRASTGTRVAFLRGGGPHLVPSGAESVTVKGAPAHLSPGVTAGASTTLMTLVWRDADFVLTMTGIGLTREEVVQMAESVERVSDDEWSRVVTQSPAVTMPPTLGPPNFATATELARLVAADGNVIRLLITEDGARVCVSYGSGVACSSPPPPGLPARLINLTGGHGVVALPDGLPVDLTIRRASGEVLRSARSADGRYLLIAGAVLGTDFDIVDTEGRIVATVKGVPCPSTGSTAACGPSTTSR